MSIPRVISWPLITVQSRCCSRLSPEISHSCAANIVVKLKCWHSTVISTGAISIRSHSQFDSGRLQPLQVSEAELTVFSASAKLLNQRTFPQTSPSMNTSMNFCAKTSHLIRLFIRTALTRFEGATSLERSPALPVQSTGYSYIPAYHEATHRCASLIHEPLDLVCGGTDAS